MVYAFDVSLCSQKFMIMLSLINQMEAKYSSAFYKNLATNDRMNYNIFKLEVFFCESKGRAKNVLSTDCLLNGTCGGLPC